jgi:hypothetical protein
MLYVVLKDHNKLIAIAAWGGVPADGCKYNIVNCGRDDGC